MSAFEENVRLAGERVVLRRFGLDDAAALIEVLRAGEDFLPPNFPTALEAEPIAWFLTEGVHSVQRLGLGLHLAVADRATDALLGTIGLFRVDRSQGTCEVGYGMRPGARGRGHATEALTLLSRWALLDAGLHRVELRALVTNHASIRVAEKAAYRREGIARGAERGPDGRNHDMVVFGLITPDLGCAGAVDVAPEGAEGVAPEGAMEFASDGAAGAPSGGCSAKLDPLAGANVGRRE